MFGVSRVKFDSDPRVLFRASDPQFAELEQFHADFGPDDHDCLLVIEGDDFFTPAVLEALRDSVDGLKADPDVESVLSIFSVRKAGPIPLMLIPIEDLSADRLQRVRANVNSSGRSRPVYVAGRQTHSREPPDCVDVISMLTTWGRY